MKLYYQNRSNLLNELIGRVELTTNLLEADAYLTWNGVLREQVKNIELARENGKPSIVYSHGHNSENDHNPNIKDNETGQGGSPMTADKYLSYGQQGKDILLKSGVPENKIDVVGCPICWNYKYAYEFDGKGAILNGFAGETVKDPRTGDIWKLIDSRVEPVTHLGGKRVSYFPNHSMHHKKLTKQVYSQLKDFKDLCIKGTSGWLLEKEENPFTELLSGGADRIKRMVCPDIQHANSLEITKALIQKSAVVICDVPSTLNLIAYACGVPVIMPDHDWNIRDKENNRVDIWTPADIIVPVKDIKKTVKDILKNGISEERKQLLAQEAEYSAGISLGNPADNIIKSIQGVVNG